MTTTLEVDSVGSLVLERSPARSVASLNHVHRLAVLAKKLGRGHASRVLETIDWNVVCEEFAPFFR